MLTIYQAAHGGGGGEETDGERAKATQLQSQSSQSQPVVSQPESQSDECLIGKALLAGSLKKADLKEDLEPWLLAQRTYLTVLDIASKRVANIDPSSDWDARWRTAMETFDTVTACEIAVEIEEEKLKRRRIGYAA